MVSAKARYGCVARNGGVDSARDMDGVYTTSLCSPSPNTDSGCLEIFWLLSILGRDLMFVVFIV